MLGPETGMPETRLTEVEICLRGWNWSGQDNENHNELNPATCRNRWFQVDERVIAKSQDLPKQLPETLRYPPSQYLTGLRLSYIRQGHEASVPEI